MSSDKPKADPQYSSSPQEDSYQEFLRDVLCGLSADQKSVPGKYLWDEEGSTIFDRACTSPDYYVARQETALLRLAANEIAGLVGQDAVLVEFGSGASHKVRLLLDALRTCRRYIAVDISKDYLEAATARIAADYPDLDVVPVAGDYSRPLDLPLASEKGPVLGFFPGNAIGNFEASAVVAFLVRVREGMGPSRFLIGVDPNDERESLARAYGGGGSLLGAFHQNLLTRMVRELGAELTPEHFRHEPRVFDDPLHVEAHLVARQASVIRIGQEEFSFASGDSIHTDNSFKYTPDAFRELAIQAGWTPVQCWIDDEKLSSLHLLQTG